MEYRAVGEQTLYRASNIVARVVRTAFQPSEAFCARITARTASATPLRERLGRGGAGTPNPMVAITFNVACSLSC